MTDVELKDRSHTRSDGQKDNVRFYGVHHLALNTDDMKMTVDFYAGVLGMRLVHAMKVPPGLGSGPGRGPTKGPDSDTTSSRAMISVRGCRPAAQLNRLPGPVIQNQMGEVRPTSQSRK